MKKIIFVVALLITVFAGIANAEYFRRHYLIVVDQTPEVFKSTDMKDLYIRLKSLFTNTNNDTVQFDPKTDDITLYAFGIEGAYDAKTNLLIKETDFADINYYRNDHQTQYRKFIDSFIGYRGSLSTYSNGTDVDAFLEEKLHPLFTGADQKAEAINNNSGVTLSKYVYPAILHPSYNSNPKPSVENYIIYVTNFQSGQYDKGTSDDVKILRSLVGSEDGVKYFNSQLDKLEEPFYEIPIAKLEINGNTNAHPIVEIKKLGVKAFEGVTTYITSNLEVTEKSSKTFNISPVEISFNKTDEVVVDSIMLEIYKGSKMICHKDIMENATIDSIARKYIISGMDVKLDENINRNDVLKFCYVFYTNALDNDGKAIMPIVYLADREVPGNTIHFLDVEKRRNQAIWGTIIALVLLLLILTMLGRKKKLNVHVGRFAQKYVNVSDTEGAIELPCWFIKKDNTGSLQNSLLVEGNVKRNISFAIGGSVKFYARLQNCKPAGFSWYINNHQVQDFVEIPLKRGKFKFNITIRVEDPSLIYGKLNHCQALLDFKIESKIFGLFPHIDNPLPEGEEIEFYVKEDLGRAWVGFDPGTTGSCVAFGNTGGSLDNPSIRLVKQKNGEEIIPSILIFDEPIKKSVYKNLEPGKDYKYGEYAYSIREASARRGYPIFRSIKKLLGYKNSADDINDRVEVKVGETKTRFSGLELAHLLVKGLKEELDRNVRALSSSDKTRFVGENKEAKRAVVAIPNNYTLPKITEMVKSIRMLDTFEEVRFVYEAEGVLFNYLRKRYKDQKPGTEVIMVYDMGGATINITIFQVTYTLQNDSIHYHIRTLGRIGYAVGGDNIDVALIEYFFTAKTTKPGSVSARHKYELEHKDEILNLITKIKINAVVFDRTGNIDDSNTFFSEENYQNDIENIVDGYSDVKEEQSKSAKARIQEIVKSKSLKEYVYDNIEDAVNEILAFPQVASARSIDTIIFSGRSTLFPNVKDTVLDIVRRRYPRITEYEGFSDEEVKTSVAYGACWYGIYNSLITVDNSNLSSAYGFKITRNGASNLNVLLNQNDEFNDDGEAWNEENLSNNFNADGNVVDFFQISGSGYGDDLFSEGNRHKVTPIGSIDVVTETDTIGMSVDRNNNVTCWIVFDTGQKAEINDLKVTGRDIEKDNDWAYTFHTQKK